jgi:hypothetical protein
MSSSGQPKRGGPPGWVSGEGLTSHRKKKTACYEMLHRASNLETDSLKRPSEQDFGFIWLRIGTSGGLF